MIRFAPLYGIYAIFLIWAFLKMSKVTDAEIEQALAQRLAKLGGVDPDQFSFEFNLN